MTQAPHELDVRPILRAGGEPFSAIMEAVNGLAAGQSFRLLATFEPVPLYAVLAKKGFDHAAREIGGGDWEVMFTPAATAVARNLDKASRCSQRWKMLRHPDGRNPRVISTIAISIRPSRWCARLRRSKSCGRARFCARCFAANPSSSFRNLASADTNGTEGSKRTERPTSSWCAKEPGRRPPHERREGSRRARPQGPS